MLSGKLFSGKFLYFISHGFQEGYAKMEIVFLINSLTYGVLKQIKEMS